MFIVDPHRFGAAVVTWDAANMHASYTLSAGNTVAACSDGNGANWESVRATLAGTGKRYCEGVITAGTNNTLMIGLANGTQNLSGDTYPGKAPSSIGYLGVDGKIYVNAAVIATGPTFTTNDVIGVAFDAATGNVWLSKNGVYILSGDPATGANPVATGFTGSVFPAAGNLNAQATFRGRWALTDLVTAPPTGFVAWGA